MSSSVLVLNPPESLTTLAVTNLFSAMGVIASINHLVDQEGHGYFRVTFEDPSSAQNTIDKFDMFQIGNMSIRVVADDKDSQKLNQPIRFRQIQCEIGMLDAEIEMLDDVIAEYSQQLGSS